MSESADKRVNTRVQGTKAYAHMGPSIQHLAPHYNLSPEFDQLTQQMLTDPSQGLPSTVMELSTPGGSPANRSQALKRREACFWNLCGHAMTGASASKAGQRVSVDAASQRTLAKLVEFDCRSRFLDTSIGVQYHLGHATLLRYTCKTVF